MGLGEHIVLVVVGKHAEYGSIIEAEAGEHRVGAGQFQNLRCAQTVDQIGNFATDTEAENCCGFIRADHLLRDHQVTEIRVADCCQYISSVHTFPFVHLKSALQNLALEYILT